MSTPDSIFGNIVTRKDVELAVTDMIKTWVDSYLAEIERKEGMDVRQLPRPRSYSRRNEFDHWPEEQIPAIIVVSPGLVDAPLADGRGRFTGDWQVGVAVIVEGQTTDNTRDLAGYYTAALRLMMLQRPSLGGFAMGVIWEDERYDDISDLDAGRTMASGQVVFQVTVENIASRNAGPVTPDTPPVTPPDTSPTWPVATEVTADVELEDINGS